jgi:hypothetical protein
MHVNVNWSLERQVIRKRGKERERGCWIKKNPAASLLTQNTFVIVSDGLHKDSKILPFFCLSLQNSSYFFLASQTMATMSTGADVSISPRFYARNIPYFTTLFIERRETFN